MQAYMQAISCLPPQLMRILSGVDEKSKSRCIEICFRIGQPIVLNLTGGCHFVSGSEQIGRVMESDYHKIPSYRIERKDMDEMLRRFTDYSIHTHTAELHEGFLTLKGGHRAGFCGSYIKTEGSGYGYRISKIQAIHLRIARQKQHLADPLIRMCNDKNKLLSFLIVGPPASGKTTVLRDFARAVSNGECCGGYYKVSILDERNEICAMSEGVPQFALGVQADCFTGYPKALAAKMAVRTMSPKLIVLDELTGEPELDAIKDSFYCGVKTAATVHAANIAELSGSRLGKSLLQSGCFDHVVLLDGNHPGKIRYIKPIEQVLL